MRGGGIFLATQELSMLKLLLTFGDNGNENKNYYSIYWGHIGAYGIGV